MSSITSLPQLILRAHGLADTGSMLIRRTTDNGHSPDQGLPLIVRNLILRLPELYLRAWKARMSVDWRSLWLYLSILLVDSHLLGQGFRQLFVAEELNEKDSNYVLNLKLT